MQDNDDVIVVIVDDAGSNNFQDFPVPTPQALLVRELIENVEKYGEHIELNLDDTNLIIKLEDIEDEPQYKETLDGNRKKIQKNRSDQDRYKHRYKIANLLQRNSFVKQLVKNNPRLAVDEEKLVEALAIIMSDVKPPSPPRDYFLMNQDSFECAFCGALTETIPAATRHYQDKHGERYLTCYACGADFRCNTNLYKHEKHCRAPDAQIVLKARALLLGRKGKNRPFLASSDWKFSHKSSRGIKPKEQMSRLGRRYKCDECSATFSSATNLRSHTNLHKGMRPHSCPHCPSRYTSPSSLNRHLKSHSSAQVICDHCGRAFKLKSTLVAHMNTHAPERKYGCVQCSRRFAQKQAMEQHVNRDHKHLPPPYACDVCHKRYTRMSMLKKHLKNKHDLQLMTKNMYCKALPKMSDCDANTCEAKIFHKHEAKIEIENEEFKDKLAQLVDENEIETPQSEGLNQTISNDFILVHSGDVMDLNDENNNNAFLLNEFLILI